MHCITPLTPSAYLVQLHNRTLIVIKFVLINTHAEAKFTQGNSALLQYRMRFVNVAEQFTLPS